MTDHPIRLEYNGELMNNYASLKAVGGGREFKTLMDEKNHPLIFSIGEDGELRMICQGEDSSAPWNLTALTTGPVHTFAVAQNPQSREIRVAYATWDGQKSRLYSSKPRNNDRTALRTVSALGAFEWVEHGLYLSDEEVDKIEMDFDHIMFSCRSRSHEASYYAAGFDGPITKFALPQYATKIDDFRVGSYPRKSGGIRGTYLLYSVEGAGREEQRALLFQSFPGPDPNERITQKAFGVSGLPESIELIRKTDGKDQLLACGDSVYLYTTNEADAELLIESRGSSFSGIQVTQHDGHCSIWVSETVNSKTQLLFLTDRYFDADQKSFKPEPQWTADLPFMQHVRQFSCVNGASDGVHLILIDDQDGVSHLSQDPLTTLWRQDAISIESLGIREFPCYTTRFVLFDGQEGPPVAGKSCYVSASSQVNATINGIAYRLDSQNPVEVATDVMGALTIISPVDDDITTPVFYVRYDGHQPSHILNPSHMVEDRLRAIKTAADFKAARTDEPNGAQYLWPSGQIPDDADLGDSATIIQHLLDCKQDMLNDELAKLTGARSAQPAESKPEMWGAQFGDGRRVRYLDHDSAGKLLPPDDENVRRGFHPFKWIGHAIGTVIHSIKSFFGKLRSFVVQKINGITTFILNLAEETVRFVIDTLEKVFPFLKVIFDAIGLVFKTVLHWLGRLLGWNDIWATHKMIARLTRNGTRSLRLQVEQSVPTWQADVDAYVKRLQEELAGITDNDKRLPDDETKKRNKVFGIFSDLLTSPLFTWPMYMLLHSGVVIKEAYLLTIGRIKALDDFVEQQAAIHNEVVTIVKREMGAIIAFAVSPDFSTRGLLKLFRPLLDLILKTLSALLQGLLGFLAEAMKTLEELLDDSAKIPFVGPMYKFVTKLVGEEEEFNFLNSFSLMISVPFTIFYKLFSGGSKPFEEVPDGFGEPEMFDAFWKPPALQSARHGEAADGASAGEDTSTWDEIVAYYRDIAGIAGCFAAILGRAIDVVRIATKGKVGRKINMVFNIITHATTIPVATAAELDEPKKQTGFELQWGQYVVSCIPAYVLPNLQVSKKDKNVDVINMIASVACLGTNIASNVLFSPGPESWIGQMMWRAGSLVSGAGAIADNVEALAAGAGLSYVGGVVELPSTEPGWWGTF